MSKNTGLRDLLRQLASRPEGVSTQDPELKEFKHSSSALDQLRALGELVRVRLAYRHVRYFTEQRDADRCYREYEREQARKQRAALEREKLIPLQKAPWGPNDPAIVPAHVKVQQCPPVQGRLVGFAERENPLLVHALQRGRVRT